MICCAKVAVLWCNVMENITICSQNKNISIRASYKLSSFQYNIHLMGTFLINFYFVRPYCYLIFRYPASTFWWADSEAGASTNCRWRFTCYFYRYSIWLACRRWRYYRGRHKTWHVGESIFIVNILRLFQLVLMWIKVYTYRLSV